MSMLHRAMQLMWHLHRSAGIYASLCCAVILIDICGRNQGLLMSVQCFTNDNCPLRVDYLQEVLPGGMFNITVLKLSMN